MLRKLAVFFALLGVVILATYYAPAAVKTPFYILLLAAYLRSKNEGMWLVLFLTISDGFWGYFSAYEVVLKLIPGLPPIEVGHLYVALTLVKASNRESPGAFFHDNFLKVIMVYIGFLIFQGYFLGLSPQMNVQFRLIKFLFPLALFVSVPRLFRTEEDFREVFVYLFPMVFLALFAQVFTITTGHTPSQYLGVYKKFWFTVDVAKGKTYRGFYSSGTVLISYFGAFYYLARKENYFNYMYLFSIVAAGLLCVILSATRGWLIGFSLSLFLFLLFVLRLNTKRLATVLLTGGLLVVGLLMIPVVAKQFGNAFKRFTTLEKLAGGDVTAGGTLERIDKRSPRVMDKWSEAPLTGWGFSDTFFKYADFHVANQNVLLHSGILGLTLMVLFFIYYHGMLLSRYLELPRGRPFKDPMLVFVLFFPGWYMIHSSSGQHFSFYQDPCGGIITAFYFSFGAFTFKKSFIPKTRSAPPAIQPSHEPETSALSQPDP